MGNYIADSNRVFNQRGQRIYDAISGLLGTFFALVMIIYAGVRGHHVVTQLPATYRTTQAPNLIPIDYFDDFFPSAVPNASFEYPAVTICADDPFATLNLTSCSQVGIATAIPCDNKGIIAGNLLMEGNLLSCVTVNQYPGSLLIAGTPNDVFSLGVTVAGTQAGGHDGINVWLHDQSNATYKTMFNMTFDNFFAAAPYTVVEIMTKKVIEINLWGEYEIDFETKVSTLSLNVPRNASNPSPITLEVRYPALEVTYEKAFLPLDMFNWLGEVGGVASLLAFVHRAVVFIVPLVLLRFDRYTDVKAKKPNNYESFSNY
ncbi:hypothetical protein BC830DRAFT_1098556 [Chytriomyces sp. MP71]|nr:hypothetical protein BC830DRAFT_1098556 [Chytriomyces sp. MP71]